MRWSAEAALLWPPDGAWQRAWGPVVREVLDSAVDGSGRVSWPSQERDGEPDLRLVAGTHLQPGAEYRLAPHVTTGVLRGWVGTQREVGLEWAPHDEPGRAHVEVRGLDRLTGVRGRSTLRYLTGQVSFDPRPESLFDATVEVPWLRVQASARSAGSCLRVELRVRGLGLWWPVLAPLFATASSRVQRELDELVRGLAEGLTALPAADTTRSAWTSSQRPSLEERRARAEREIAAGMAEIARRQRAAAEAMALEPWWRRSGDRWQRALDELPAPSWPDAEAVVGADWAAVERAVTRAVLRRARWRRAASIDTEVARVSAAQLALWQEIDHGVTKALDESSTDPWLVDTATDLSWLATPWSTVRHFTGAASDAEARARAEAAVASAVS